MVRWSNALAVPVMDWNKLETAHVLTGDRVVSCHSMCQRPFHVIAEKALTVMLACFGREIHVLNCALCNFQLLQQYVYSV